MNSLVSVLKRTAWVLLCLRAAIYSLMVLLTNIWAGDTLDDFHFVPVHLYWFTYFVNISFDFSDETCILIGKLIS